MHAKLVFVLLLFGCTLCYAQQPDFAATERYDVPNLSKLVGTTSVIPFFLNQGNKFWFVANDAPGLTSAAAKKKSPANYYLADPDKKQLILLFDKQAIVKSLATLTTGAIDTGAINYTPDFLPGQQTVALIYKNVKYAYNYTTKKLAKYQEPPKEKIAHLTGDRSPDKHWLLYARNHNLYLKNLADTTSRQLSRDGALNYSFSLTPADEHVNFDTGTGAVWTADSKSFYVLRKDTRKVKTLTVINSLTSPRPYVNTYPYELPGDKDVTQYELFIGNTGDTVLKKINIERWPDQAVSIVPSAGITGEMFILRKKRSRDEVELCAVNIKTGQLRVVIHEVSKPFINEDLFHVAVVNQGKDIIWWSDRSGWGQYYHYDSTGKLLNAITAGNWTAGRILNIDTLGRGIYFYGFGKEQNSNPNYAYLYKVGFDGKKQMLLTTANATHNVFISKDRKYLVDNYSRIDLEPRTVVLDNKGHFVQQILKADMSALYAYGWKQPEQFKVKAKDGVTDLYGLMWKPFNFDPNKKYPIISQVYPGPQIETVWTEFTVFDRYNNTSLAQTGFIVVVMGHRGGTPLREAKYYKYGYGNLRDYALEDDRYGLEQLAARFNFIDLKRVGIFGHSGGGMMATAALCTYPDFYKVAVASSANHDNNIYNRTWGETYQGLAKPVAVNQSLAKNLKGHLLLVSGESDANVNPANTMRMADALIKANKDFDMLILPGQSHAYEEPYKTYFQKRLREYFARYLLEGQK
ncbi:S9 family peptidase [Mucilaginibacter paludis]|uniref:Peptidase S9B dipeptidylpeptidase IV domain-containing protein n=1 Tax=Mucilaginibacter paludis DSM 18603 TaxID=714943 RepID=H1Y341_9SPHI|nr:DPP IV N-terminal domain-containing protein [Mucilaginibacter paludis]EHQ28859.1 peptidase S9B dipeptidylpeptidase IV domain-containing protein [Mucilaginibacter paludis DSM 18603]